MYGRRVCVRTCARAYVRMCARVVHACVWACVRAYVLAYVLAWVRLCICVSVLPVCLLRACVLFCLRIASCVRVTCVHIAGRGSVYVSFSVDFGFCWNLDFELFCRNPVFFLVWEYG